MPVATFTARVDKDDDRLFYIYVSNEPVRRTVSAGDGVNVDYDAEGQVCGIELLGSAAPMAMRSGEDWKDVRRRVLG